MAGLEGKQDQILEQLSAQKEDISQLQTDLRQRSKTVSTEVKKIKERADFHGESLVTKFSIYSIQRLKRLLTRLTGQ